MKAIVVHTKSGRPMGGGQFINSTKKILEKEMGSRIEAAMHDAAIQTISVCLIVLKNHLKQK